MSDMDTRRFKVKLTGTAQATATIEIDVPVEWLAGKSFAELDFNNERINELARFYVDNLASDDGVTIDWDLGPIRFTAVTDSEEVKA